MDLPVAPLTERVADSASPQDAVSWLMHELAVATSRYDVAVGAQLAVSATDFLALKYVLMSEDPLGTCGTGDGSPGCWKRWGRSSTGRPAGAS